MFAVYFPSSIRALLTLLVSVAFFISSASACPDVEGLVDINCDGQMKIMAFGDSITAGYTVTEFDQGTCHFGIGDLCDSLGGYPGRLNDLIPGAVVFNEGRSSEDTQQALSRYPDAFSSVENLDYIIILEGVNDLWRAHAFGWQPFRTRNNLLTMVEDAEDIGAVTLLGSLLDSTKVFPGATVYTTRQEWIDDVNEEIEPYVDIDFSILGLTVVSTDGTHPDGPGYQVMAGMVLSAMVEAGEENRPEDLDQDNIYDFAEGAYGTSATDNDTDNDGLLDGDEIFVYGTSPLLADTDGDGVNDYDEVNVDSPTTTTTTTTTSSTTSTSPPTTTTSTSSTTTTLPPSSGVVEYRYGVAQAGFVTFNSGVVWEADPCLASLVPFPQTIWKFPKTSSGEFVLDLRRLYQSVTEQPFYECGFSVAEPGNYEVTLHFAEMDSDVEVGDNVFDIYIENELRQSGLDLLDNALGYPLETAFTISYAVETVDQEIDIRLQAVEGNARLAGVEIGSVGGSTATSTTTTTTTTSSTTTTLPSSSGVVEYRYGVAQTGFVTFDSGVAWQADPCIGSLAPFPRTIWKFPKTPSGEIVRDLRRLYQSVTEQPFYDCGLSVAEPGNYEVTLHFAEMDSAVEVGENVFDIYIEDELREAGLDLLGDNSPGYPLETAFTINYAVETLDDEIDIRLQAVQGNVRLAGVEISFVGGTTATTTTTTTTSSTTTTIPSSSGVLDYRYGVAQESFVTFDSGVVWESDPCIASQVPLPRIIWKFPRTSSGEILRDLRRLYQSVTDQPVYECGFGVAGPGNYEVTLHFAEMDSEVEMGDNVFDIYIENELRESGMDLLDESGLGYPLETAFTINYAVETVDDEIDIRLQAVQGNVRLAGVEITFAGGS